jgi:hypothetical protein
MQSILQQRFIQYIWEKQRFFLVENCLSHLHVFKQLTSCTPHSGNTILLWYDKWADTMLRESLPQLYSFAKNKDITLQQVKHLNLDELYEKFQLPLSLVTLEQINNLHIAINSFMDSNTTHDKWILTGGGDNFSTKKVYATLVKAPPTPKPFKWIWKSPCLPKHKFFFCSFCKTDLIQEIYYPGKTSS